MPTYEYHCDACQHEFEEFQYFSEDPLTKCPACKKKKLRRLFGTGASIIFKGSGFYETDYRSESYKAGARAESDTAKPVDDKAKSDAKPAADSKPATKPAKGGTKGSGKSKGGTTATAG